MKKAIVAVLGVAVVGGVAAYLIGTGGKTDDTIVKKVDSISQVKTMRLDSLKAEVAVADNQSTRKLDSLTMVLEEVKWEAVKDGGDYEAEAKKKFVTKKRETASAFKQVYDDNRINVESEFLMNIQKISE